MGRPGAWPVRMGLDMQTPAVPRINRRCQLQGPLALRSYGAVAAVVARLLQKSPTARYPDVGRVLQALAESSGVALAQETGAVRECFLQAAADPRSSLLPAAAITTRRPASCSCAAAQPGSKRRRNRKKINSSDSVRSPGLPADQSTS